MDREERVAKNEILFRQVNERIREIEGERWRVDPVDFMCECGDHEVHAGRPDVG